MYRNRLRETVSLSPLLRKQFRAGNLVNKIFRLRPAKIKLITDALERITLVIVPILDLLSCGIRRALKRARIVVI